MEKQNQDIILKKKKVLYLTHDYLTFTKDQIETLSSKVGELHVIVRYNRIKDISKIFPIKRLSQYNKEKLMDFLDVPENVKIYVASFPYFTSNSSYKSVGEKHYMSALKIIDKYKIKFDLIHAHFVWSSGYVAMKLKEKYGIPFLVTAHGYDIYDLPFRDSDWGNRIKQILNATDHIITVSNKNYKCIQRLNVSTPVTIIPNGFKTSKFHVKNQIDCRNKLKLPLDKKIILAVGNLLEVKGHKYLIDAMSEIVNNYSNVLCIIIGDGVLKKQLNDQIYKLGLHNQIIMTGQKPHYEISDWINACDVFALPSLNEGVPTVLFEALGCGKPIIGSKVGGIPDIVLSQEVGSLIAPGDSSSLSKNLIWALNRKWDSQKIVDYSKQYRWENLSEQISTIYSSILKKVNKKHEGIS